MTVVVAVAFAVGLFIVIPLVVVKDFEETFSNPFVFNLVEGVIRIVLFLLYILGISLIPDLRRVFQYHGAEHKVIHAYEACGRPDAKRAEGYPPMHPRCGTGFLLVVMVIAILVFAVVGKPSLLWLVMSRIVGIPIIIGISYEVGIKWLGRHPNELFARVLLWPGLQLQRLTTREPTPDQLEVAAAALDEVMQDGRAEAAGAQGGGGSGMIERLAAEIEEKYQALTRGSGRPRDPTRPVPVRGDIQGSRRSGGVLPAGGGLPRGAARPSPRPRPCSTRAVSIRR